MGCCESSDRKDPSKEPKPQLAIERLAAEEGDTTKAKKTSTIKKEKDSGKKAKKQDKQKKNDEQAHDQGDQEKEEKQVEAEKKQEDRIEEEEDKIVPEERDQADSAEQQVDIEVADNEPKGASDQGDQVEDKDSQSEKKSASSSDSSSESDKDTEGFTVKAASSRYTSKDDLEKKIAKKISKWEKNGTKFNTLTLSGNSYGYEACEFIAQELIPRLGSSDNFSKVFFNDMFVSRDNSEIPQALKILIEAIGQFPITHLNLSQNALGKQCIFSFEDYLKTSSTLISLDVTNCGISAEVTEQIANALLENGNTKLRELKIGKQRVENQGALALAKYIETYDSLEVLDVHCNTIKEEGFEALLTSLIPSAESGALKHLDINDNMVQGESFERLLDVIKTVTKLEFLSISDCLIEDVEQHQALRLALVNSPSHETLETFRWNYDAECYTNSKPFLADFSEEKNFPSLKEVQMIAVVASKTVRDTHRDIFEKRGVKVFFTERELDDDSDSDGFSESHESSEGSNNNSD